MSKVLIISGHPSLGHSTANKNILAEVQKLLPDAQVRFLDKLYPDFKINVAAEQAALEQADVIVWQFPVHWYALPALLKKWLDDVFTFGFAYGTNSTKLVGKKLLLSFTTASAAEQYQYGGTQNYPFTDFLNTHRQTANLCKLIFQEPVISYGALYMPGVHPAERLAEVETLAKDHAKRLVTAINK